MSAVDAHIRPDLIDRLIELYCEWRTCSAQVQAAWDRFLGGSSDDRAAAFAVYTAALDREQSACELYAGQIRLIQAGSAPRADAARWPQTSRTDGGR